MPQIIFICPTDNVVGLYLTAKINYFKLISELNIKVFLKKSILKKKRRQVKNELIFELLCGIV